jgi:hypothetical protein
MHLSWIDYIARCNCTIVPLTTWLANSVRAIAAKGIHLADVSWLIAEATILSMLTIYHLITDMVEKFRNPVCGSTSDMHICEFWCGGHECSSTIWYGLNGIHTLEKGTL